jgi:hypothetical protein
LRGFRQHQAVYGMCQEGEAPCSPKRLAQGRHRNLRASRPLLTQSGHQAP